MECDAFQSMVRRRICQTAWSHSFGDARQGSRRVRPCANRRPCSTSAGCATKGARCEVYCLNPASAERSRRVCLRCLFNQEVMVMVNIDRSGSRRLCDHNAASRLCVEMMCRGLDACGGGRRRLVVAVSKPNKQSEAELASEGPVSLPPDLTGATDGDQRCLVPDRSQKVSV